MFLCISLNPAMDKRMRLERLRLRTVNRVHNVCVAPGGKAAHVAMVLKTLGGDVTWLGFAGGASGYALLDGLRKLSIPALPISITGETRTNLELMDESGVTEILEPVPRSLGLNWPDCIVPPVAFWIRRAPRFQ